MEIRRTDVPLSHSWVINHPAKIYYSPNSVDSFVGCSWASLPSELQLEDWLAQRPPRVLLTYLKVVAGVSWVTLILLHLVSHPPIG